MRILVELKRAGFRRPLWRGLKPAPYTRNAPNVPQAYAQPLVVPQFAHL